MLSNGLKSPTHPNAKAHWHGCSTAAAALRLFEAQQAAWLAIAGCKAWYFPWPSVGTITSFAALELVMSDMVLQTCMLAPFVMRMRLDTRCGANHATLCTPVILATAQGELFCLQPGCQTRRFALVALQTGLQPMQNSLFDSHSWRQSIPFPGQPKSWACIEKSSPPAAHVHNSLYQLHRPGHIMLHA